ncbi:MAG: hypothetical protein HC927_07805 [Deltaproteobacteria bacterium]|nr:hypothetical protein [Deltaproteobacteria bacterium]
MPLQVLSILVILVIAATYLLLEIEREDARLEKDPSAEQAGIEGDTLPQP